MADNDSGDIADRYEFDTPCVELDPKEQDKDESVDAWFDQQPMGADNRQKTSERFDQPFMRGDVLNLPRPIVSPHVKTRMDSDLSLSTAPLYNIVPSWSGGSSTETGARPKRKTAHRPPAQPYRVSKRKETNSIPAAPPSKKHKKPSNSEEQELVRIRNLQKEVAQHRKKNEASFKLALAGNPPPKKMALSATVPKEFYFATNTRAKASTCNTNSKEIDFVSQLRKPSSPTKTTRSATVPKPFNLSISNRKKLEEASAYVPVAQQIEQFQKRTPDRYHLRSRKSQERGPSPLKGDHLRLTQPHTPHLITQQRTRASTIKSHTDLEAEEIDRLQKYKFKAQELNRKIIEGAEVLKKPAVKEPTVPEGFDLQIEKRLQERQACKPQEGQEKLQIFKSRPLPKKILEEVVGLPEKMILPPTVPESPAFTLKKKIHREPTVEVKQPMPMKAPPVPHFGLPFQPQLPGNHHIEVCPFSFEERERERKALKEKRLERKSEEAPKFKAQPLPNFETVILPEKKKLEPTKPEPFRLLIDERATVRSSRLEQMVKDEQKQQREAAQFKARPNTVIYKEPFLPRKDGRTAVVPEAFELSTERRAQERQEFERLASEKEAIRTLIEEEQRREEVQREKEEIIQLRQEQVHKAQPIRHYKPVSLKKGEVPLTVPQSPNFCDRFRL